MLLEQERKQAVAYSQLMLKRGLTRGTGGNISIYNRREDLWVITPSGIEYDAMLPEEVVVLDREGRVVEGAARPSSELEMHRRCYLARPDIGAVVHTHSTYAAVLACMRKEIPAVHYLVGYAGDSVPCIPYYTFGSAELAQAAGAAFGQRPDQRVILLGNHGLLAVGNDVTYAFNAAEEIEFVAELYYHVLLSGEVHVLSEEKMRVVREKFAVYGQKQAIKVK